MRLSKAKLIKLVKPYMEELGYVWFKDSISGFQGLFGKKVSNDLYLSFGLTIHRFYDAQFTGNFYLSKTTKMGFVINEMPRNMYNRPGFFLTEEEIEYYANDGINVPKSKDVWWDPFSENGIRDFIETVKKTEPRFLNNPQLIQQIYESPTVELYYQRSKEVREKYLANNFNREYTCLPPKEVDDIPLNWFKASEEVLSKVMKKVDLHTSKSLASDAYRQYILDGKW